MFHREETMSTDNIFWAEHEQASAIQPARFQRWKDKDKAGIIPYFREEDGTFKFLMMVASNPQFGGYKPMISKGSVEDNELVDECAFREAEEELGLTRDNCIGQPFLVFKDYVKLRSVEYNLTVYAVEVASKQNFIEPGSETKFTTWMSFESFMDRGRKDHQPIVQRLYESLQ
jgi:8-oxo-dGTP pyrophosphatase MutT (NUDIX family)